MADTFADDIFKRMLSNENNRISNKISLKYVPWGPIDDMSALVQIMAWRHTGDKPLCEPMLWCIYAALGGDELMSVHYCFNVLGRKQEKLCQYNQSCCKYLLYCSQCDMNQLPVSDVIGISDLITQISINKMQINKVCHMPLIKWHQTLI